MRLSNPTRSTAGFCLLFTSTALAQSPSAAINATFTSATIQPTTVTLTTSVNSYQATSSGSSLIAASTAVPEPTAALNSTVSYAPLPPVQDWCPGGPNSSYCPGALLQLVQLSGLYADSKVFPDKPTNGTANETAQAFFQLPQNATVGEVQTFVEANFRGEGLEIVPVAIEGFNATPAVLDQVEDPFLKGFVSIVNGYWALLIRETNNSAVCTEDVCDSSLIPLNNTIVVPGGRYREVYYWDSFWILEGLLKSELYDYANDLLTNFMDLLDLYGFLPNGGRKYYLNRSQPPVFVQMVNSYILVTGNTTILERALPLMETELEWWRTNRTFSLTSPFTGRNHSVAIFNVTNSAPRPEGYVEDYETAFGATPALNESQRSALYAELATGAESGWDYSSRWCKEPLLNVSDNYPALRTLNGRAIVPVDLNSLLYGDHVLLANLYETYLNGSSGNGTSSLNATGRIAQHRMIASEFESAILDLFWDPARSYFYDFNTTANDRASIFHAGGLFPLWQNITPSEIMGNETAALNVFQGIRYIAGKYPGSPSVATLLETGLNWDAPNVWPPHTYTSIKALETLGRLYPNGTVLNSVISKNFSSIPFNQLGLNETDLPEQPQDAIGPNSAVFARSVAEVQEGLPWWKAIAIEYANRYMLSAFCSWYSTGGAIPGVLSPLSSGTLNATGANPTDTGHIFEKFNATDVDAAGGGGEYEVVIGFGWTNGVILHTAGEYGEFLVSPACPLIVLVDGGDANTTSANNTGRIGSALFSDTDRRLAQGYRVPPLHV